MPENPNTRVDNTRKLQTVTAGYRIAQAFTSNSEATSLPGHMHAGGDGQPAGGLACDQKQWHRRRPTRWFKTAFKVAQVGQISDIKLAHPMAVQPQRHSTGNSK